MIQRVETSQFTDDHHYEIWEGKHGFRVVVVYFLEAPCAARAVGRGPDTQQIAKEMLHEEIDKRTLAKE